MHKIVSFMLIFIHTERVRTHVSVWTDNFILLWLVIPLDFAVALDAFVE